MTTFWNNCFNYIKGNHLIVDIDSNNDVKDNIFSIQKDNNNTLLPDKKNAKSENKVEISQPDKLIDLMQDLINSVDKVSEGIHEMNSHLKSGSNVLISGEHKNFNSNVSNNNSGFSLDYEEYIQKKESMVREKNG